MGGKRKTAIVVGRMVAAADVRWIDLWTVVAVADWSGVGVAEHPSRYDSVGFVWVVFAESEPEFRETNRKVCLEMNKITVKLRAYHNKDIRAISWLMNLLQIAIKFSTKKKYASKFQTCFSNWSITKEENF